MRKHPMFIDWKNEYSSNILTAQSELQIQYDSYQNANDIIHKNRKKNPKIHMETQNSQCNFEQKEQRFKC
jgi:hypothetical protein